MEETARATGGRARIRYSVYTVRKGAQVGCENSQITTRPPGLVTRYISRSAVSVSWTLRSPKEMVTASKVSSLKGSFVASPAVNGSQVCFRLPTWSMPIEKSQGTT